MKSKLNGYHADIIIINDMITTEWIPTKWQRFMHKLNPFASKVKKRVYNYFEQTEKDNSNSTDTAAMFNSH